jgi:hypothetical protein
LEVSKYLAVLGKAEDYQTVYNGCAVSSEGATRSSDRSRAAFVKRSTVPQSLRVGVGLLFERNGNDLLMENTKHLVNSMFRPCKAAFPGVQP